MKRNLAIALLMLAACSSSKPVATTSTPPSVVPSASTSTASSSTSPSTAATTLPATTTTAAPIASTTTVPVPVSETRTQVETAFNEVSAAVRDVLRSPTDAAVVARFDAATTADGSARKIGHTKIDQLNANGWKSKPNPATPASATIVGEIVVTDSPSAAAEFTSCNVDSDIVYKPDIGSGGLGAIINDEITSRTTRVTMVLLDGKWLLVKNTLVQEFKGQTSCG
jgi:hypothetical protein